MTRRYAAHHSETAVRRSSSNHGRRREFPASPSKCSLHDVPGNDSQSAAIRSLLVPLDGSLPAEHALPHALAVARRSGARLRIMHVLPRLHHLRKGQLYYSREAAERLEREKRNYLADVAGRIARTDDVRVETILVENDDVENALIEASKNADLLVMASRRRGRIRSWWSAGLADSLRSRLTIPVLLVRGYPSPVDLTGDPIARAILVPLDGSTVAERILGPAAAMGRLDAAKLMLLNVQNQEWTGGSFEHASPPGYLIGIARDVAGRGSLVNAQIATTGGSVAKAVQSFAHRNNADLIALATRSDGPWSRRLRGSVSDRLIRRTDLPVLLLRVDVESNRPEVTTVVR